MVQRAQKSSIETIVSDSLASTSGRGWHGNSAGHAEAGRKGGSKVALDRDHMAEIGRRGGSKVAQDREHMAAIGRRGGSKPAHDRQPGVDLSNHTVAK